MEHRNLAEFARWFLSNPVSALRPPARAVQHLVLQTHRQGGTPACGLVLYRKPPYQVELFTILPTDNGASSPEHRHPNVDTVEYFLSGRIAFTINGKPVISEESLSRTASDGASELCGKMVRVRPRDWHGASHGPEGGSFLSIQRWLHGIEPTSVTIDWEGPPHLSVDTIEGPPHLRIQCVDGQ